MDLDVQVPIFFSEKDEAFARLVEQSVKNSLSGITFQLEKISTPEFWEVDRVAGPRILILSQKSYRGPGKRGTPIADSVWRERNILFVTEDSVQLPTISGSHFPFIQGTLDLEFRLPDLSLIIREVVTRAEPDPEKAAILGGSLVRSADGVEINPKLFIRLDDIEFSVRTALCLKNENLQYIGDVLQYHPARLLRLPNFGRKSLNELRTELASLGLYLGTPTSKWPPTDVAQQAERVALARRLARMRPARLGIKFQAKSDFFVIDPHGEESDEAAAAKPLIQQLHRELERKIATLAPLSPRLNNQIGWRGVDELFSRISEQLGRETSKIPEVLGLLYSSALELGSFLEMDERLQVHTDSFAPPLDPEFRRPMEDLLRTLAPWLRNFPTIREIDDEAGQFLNRAARIAPAEAVIRVADDTRLIQAQDAHLMSAMLEANERGGIQGAKAGHRGVLSASNLVVAAAGLMGSFMIGAVESDFATKSYLAAKAGTFLASAESAIIELVTDFPIDLRLAIEGLLKQEDRSPFVRPAGVDPVRIVEDDPSKRRRGPRKGKIPR